MIVNLDDETEDEDIAQLCGDSSWPRPVSDQTRRSCQQDAAIALTNLSTNKNADDDSSFHDDDDDEEEDEEEAEKAPKKQNQVLNKAHCSRMLKKGG